MENVYAYEVRNDYINMIYGKIKKMNNGGETFAKSNGNTISLKYVRYELTPNQKKIYADNIRRSLIEEAKFAAAKDKSLEKDSKKWISDTKSKSDEELINEYEHDFKENIKYTC